MIFYERIDWFCRKMAKVVHETTAWNGQLWGQAVKVTGGQVTGGQVTGGQNSIWRPGSGIILEPVRWSRFCSFEIACEIVVACHHQPTDTTPRVTTCLEYLEMSGNLTTVRDFIESLVKCQGKNLVREKLPKTAYCKSKVHVELYSALS